MEIYHRVLVQVHLQLNISTLIIVNTYHEMLVSSSYKRLLSSNGWIKYDVSAGNGLHVGAKVFK